MQIFRRFLLVACLAVLPATRVQAKEPAVDHGRLVIVLEHHWVMEISGQRFGLIQFDTPMTTILLGKMNFDFPVPAFAVVAPVLLLPALVAIGVIVRRRRLALC